MAQRGRGEGGKGKAGGSRGYTSREDEGGQSRRCAGRGKGKGPTQRGEIWLQNGVEGEGRKQGRNATGSSCGGHRRGERPQRRGGKHAAAPGTTSAASTKTGSATGGGVCPSTTTPPHPPVAVQPHHPVAVQPHPPVAVQPRRWWHPRARTPPPRARQRRYLPPGVRPTHADAPLLPSPPLDTPPLAAASAPSATLDPHHRKAPAVAAVAPPTAASAAGRLARERRARLHPPPPPPAGPRRRAAGWEDAAEPVTRDARPLIASAPPLQSSSHSWVADVWICDEIGQLPPPRGPLEPPVAASATARGDGGGRNHQTVHQIDRADRGFEIGLRRQVSSPKEF